MMNVHDNARDVGILSQFNRGSKVGVAMGRAVGVGVGIADT